MWESLKCGKVSNVGKFQMWESFKSGKVSLPGFCSPPCSACPRLKGKFDQTWGSRFKKHLRVGKIRCCRGLVKIHASLTSINERVFQNSLSKSPRFASLISTLNSLFWLTDAYINSPKSPFTPIRSKMWQYLVLASTWSERQNPKEALEFQTHEIPSEKANWCKNAHYFIFFTQRVILLSTLSV